MHEKASERSPANFIQKKDSYYADTKEKRACRKDWPAEKRFSCMKGVVAATT